MTEIVTTPSAIEEWKNQRSRTADWVQRFAPTVPGIPPAPSTSTDSDWDKRSLWDGNGWEPPSDCESSTSIPPTMMLQYPDKRQVLVTPTTPQGGENPRTRHEHGHHMHREERAEHSRSYRSAERSHFHQSAPRSGHGTAARGLPSQTSSMRLARAAAAPLPDSRSSSSGVSRPQTQSTSKRSLSDAVDSASHRAASTHSHPSHLNLNGNVNAHGNAVSNGMGNSEEGARRREHVTTHTPTNSLTHPKSHTAPSQHHPSHVPSHRPSQVPSQQPSHVPSQRPSHPSHAASHQSAFVPSHQPSQAHVPSHVPSQLPSQHAQPSHPPSAFSNHTIHANPPASHPPPPASGTIGPTSPGANDAPGGAPSPPSIHSIHSRSISLADSRSSGPPEPIVIHPPSNAGSAQGQGQGVSPVQTHPPNVASSASLSYFSIPPRDSLHHEHENEHEHEQQRQLDSHSHQHTPQAQANAQLPTPVSPSSPNHPDQHSYIPPVTLMPIRAPSTMSTTGLGGGYVLVDVPSSGYEKEIEHEIAERKGSGGFKSKRERGSLFNVFGVRKGHNRSRSLPMNGIVDVPEEGHREMHQPPQTLLSPSQPSYAHRQHYSLNHIQQIPNPPPNPYLTPISPISPTSSGFPMAIPTSPQGPQSGPHPPPIVYAPARHHRAAHYAPPAIVYKEKHSPYNTQQILQAYTPGYPYPYQRQYQHGHYGEAPVYLQPGMGVMSPGGANANVMEQNVNGHGTPNSMRRSKTLQEPVRDSGWEEAKREGPRDSSAHRSRSSAERSGERDQGGVNADEGADFITRDYAHVQPTSLQANTNAAQTNENVNANPLSPVGSHAAVLASVNSDATSARTNLAGVGTVSARSRSRGRTPGISPKPLPEEPSEELDPGNGGGETERGRERSRSRARGMVYSASAPQPQAPHAAMMIPPPSAVRDRGVRDTPYPTPPGSVSEQLHQRHYQHQQHQLQLQPIYVNGHANGYAHMSGFAHKSSALLSPVSPTSNAHEASPSPGGLISRFRDIYHSSHSPISPRVANGDFGSSNPGRGRARERRRKDRYGAEGEKNFHANGNGRARSVDSEKSYSSASTYYVIPTEGQKVRIIHPNGRAATSTSTIPRAGGGWLKKASALRPRFLHRDNQQQQQHQNDPTAPDDHHQDHSSPSSHVPAPALNSRTSSGKSGKSGKSSKRGSGNKLVRRDSTGSAALLGSASRQASQGHDAEAQARADEERARDRDVDIVIPGH